LISAHGNHSVGLCDSGVDWLRVARLEAAGTTM
jgi:hypothetical protein